MLIIKKYGVWHLAVAPIRSSASDTAEIVTQLLFGDHVEILEQGKPWIKVRFQADNYEGWMDFKQLTYIEEEEYNLNLSKPQHHLADSLSEIEGTDGKQQIMFGSNLPNFDGGKVHFGERTYTFTKLPLTQSFDIRATAQRYLNTPYLWGGKSIFGIDCSALVQNIFKIHRVFLSRDASQQVNEGTLVTYTDRKLGDVPFFINDKGIVHHVGILLKKDEIIHAAGQVRVDRFDDKGIFRTDLDAYTHQFHSIRRYL